VSPAASYWEDGRQVFVGDSAAADEPRPVRGLLPGGRARYVAGETGAAIPIERSDPFFSALNDVRGVTPSADASAVRSVPAAVVDRTIDTTQPTAHAVRVSQYSGDVGASDAPLISDAELNTLRVMREDLQTFAPERGRLVRDPTDEGSSIYARGGPGSPVGDDVRIISGQHVGNDRIAAAIDDLMAGKPITNKLQVAALDAARGYLEHRPGYRGPMLPLDEAGGSTARPDTSGASGASSPAAVDSFDAFSRIFDDFEGAGPSGEPGESGFATPRFLAHLGGAAGGAALGVASGETPDEKLKRGLLFGVAGAVAPSLLLREAGAANRIAREAVDTASRSTGMPSPEASAQVPRVGRSGEPMRDPLAGLDPFLSKFSNPLVRSGIEERLISNGGYAEQRRGAIRTREIGQFANAVKVDVTRSLRRGTAVSGEVITAYGRAAQETQRRVAELADLVNSGRATDADILRLQSARADADVVLKSLMGLRSEAGRALASFRFLDSVLDTGRVDLIRGAAQTVREDAQRFAQEFHAQPTDPILRYRWLQQQGQSGLWDTARSYYYASILSGVKTHERNVLGNVFSAISNTLAHPFAAGIDAAKSAVTGAPRDVLFGELPHGVVGGFAGLDRGFQDALFTLRYGVNPATLDRSLQAGAVGKLDIPRVDFRGGAVNPLNWPSRMLDGADAFFRSVARNVELYEGAYTIAKREGRTGQPLIDRMADLRAGLTPEGVALKEQAEHVAARAVFQEKGGPITSWLAQGYRVPGLGQALTFVMPFLRTPGNIIRQGFEASPAGFAMSAARQDGRLGTLAQGKAAAGSLAAAYLAWLASTGRLSGDGPQDAAKRAALMESGWRPNSVRIGDTWVSYQPMQPLSVQAALIANAHEAWQDRGAKPKDAADVVAETFARGTNSFLEQSFLQGVFDVVEALKEPQASASRIVGHTAQGLMPFSGAERSVQQAMDPTVRQPKGIVEQIQASTPGLSERVEPRVDRFGQPVVREGGPLRRAADPFNTSTVTHDPVAEELDRLDVRLSAPSGHTVMKGQPPLTREQETELKSAKGQEIRQELEAAISAPRYERMDDPERKTALERLINRSRERAGESYKREVRRGNERAFREWYAEIAQREGLPANPDHPSTFYDWRAAWRAHAEPDQQGTWPPQFRQLGHPDLILDGVDTRSGQPATDALRRASETRRMRIERQVAR
jgi:hypothetical protein